MLYKKVNLIPRQFFFAVLAGMLIGCDDAETDPCEEMSAFACDCMTDTDEPVIGLEEGLQQGCQYLLELHKMCMATPGLDKWTIAAEDDGLTEIPASDLCDGHGLDEQPGGCMSQFQLNDLILGIDNQGCSGLDGGGPVWWIQLAVFKGWKRYWLNQ